MTTGRALAWSIASLLAVSLLGSAHAAEPPTLSPRALEEIILLNGIGGFGDTGTIETSREIVAPGNTTGYCVKVIWEEHKGGAGYWSIRVGFPAGTRLQDYDTFSGDLYVESNENANLSLYLAESDDDRWVCRGGLHGWRADLTPQGHRLRAILRRTGHSEAARHHRLHATSPRVAAGPQVRHRSQAVAISSCERLARGAGSAVVRRQAG